MNKTFKVLALVLVVAMLSAFGVVFASADEAYTDLDLGDIKTICGATFTGEGVESVHFYGSSDGENYYELNAGAAVKLAEGVAKMDWTTGSTVRGYVNVRYLRVDAPNGTIAPTLAEESGITPEGPYTMTGLNPTGYGIVYFTNADAPDGFGVNDKTVFTSNEKGVNLNASQMTIAEKVDEGVYKILWNDCNGWDPEAKAAAHMNTPAGVEGIKYENDKVYLADDQIVFIIMSSGGYATNNDGEYSTAKWIMRGMVAGDYIALGTDSVRFLKSYKSESSSEPVTRKYLWLKCNEIGDDAAPSINFIVPGNLIGEGEITVEAIVYYEDDCEYDAANGGCVYTNCYSYGNDTDFHWNGEDGLITYFDFTKDSTVDHEQWFDATKTFDPAAGTYGDCTGKTIRPVCLTMGVGFWKAKGTIRVAELNVIQNEKAVWHIDFENGFDPDNADDMAKVAAGQIYNINANNKDTAWGIGEETFTPDPHEDKTPEETDDGYEEEIKAKVGDPEPDSHFDILFTSGTDAEGNVEVTVKLKNFKDEDKVSSILFPIFFDDERLEPNFNINDDNSVNCFGDLPGEKWENMTVYNPADDTSDVNNFPGQAHVYVQILNAEKEDQVCKADTEITITLNFKLKEGFDKGGVWIPTENVEATSWDDPAGANILRATGGYIIGSLPEDQPTEQPTEQPTQPGDAGILVFAILGVLAVIGAAVVVKVRK